MNELKIILPDNSTRIVEKGYTPQDVANDIGPGLARSVVVAKVNESLKDLNIPFTEDCHLELLTAETPEGHNTLLHSAAHLMAQAVKFYWPEAKLTIGPAIAHRFYYDFDVNSRMMI